MINFEIIDCVICGNSVIKNYAAAQVLNGSDLVARYQFKCEMCGQLYSEKAAPAIALDEEVTPILKESMREAKTNDAT